MGFRPHGILALGIASEDVLGVTLGEPYLFTIRSRDPNVLLVIADGHRLAGNGPGHPAAMNLGKVILRAVLPIYNRSGLVGDQDFVVRRETEIVIAGSEKAVVAQKFSV